MMTETEPNVRFEALHSALSYALQKTLSKISLRTFVSCYPQMDRMTLDYVRKQIVSLWQSRAEEEFQKIFTERGLKDKLNELDEVIRDAEALRARWTHDATLKERQCLDVTVLTPEELVRARTVTDKKKILENLQEMLTPLQESNRELQARLAELTQNINEDLAEVSTLVEELEFLDDDDRRQDEEAFRDLVEWAVAETV